MDKKERQVQTALGEMKKFRVTALIPIKAVSRIERDVVGVNKEDAIGNMQTILELESSTAIAMQPASDARYGTLSKNIIKIEIDSDLARKFDSYELGNPGFEESAKAPIGGTLNSAV